MAKLKHILISIIAVFTLSSFVTNYFEISKNLEIFNNIYREINTYYVDPVDPGELMHSTIDTMLKRLDPYTKYIPESEVEDFRFQTTGNYGGIGATIRKIDQNIVIYEPYKGFPADKSGLKMGDVIQKIDNISIKNPNTQDVSDLLKGTPGTIVVVEIKRQGISKTYSIKREKIQIPSVSYSGILENNIGLIKLRRFTKNCTQQVEKALNQLSTESNLNGIILDLRSNPGGLLNESIKLSNLFLSKNKTVVTTNGKNSEWKKNYTTKLDPKYPSIPIVILVNSASASASEIVAGAIQDYDRGVIIGNKTFGKGLVQQSRKLNYNSRLKVTVAKYYTPSGRCIQDINQTKGYNNYINNEVDSMTNDSIDARNKFFTNNNRVVYDGGGIDPDIKITPVSYPDILISLIQENHIFKFSNQIINEFNNLNSIEECVFSEKYFEEFNSYLDEENFTFRNYNDEIINIIESSIEELEVQDKDLNNLNQEIAAVKKKLSERKKNDIEKHADVIKDRILDNIITRKFYEHGRIQNQMKSDPYVIQAIEILSSYEDYDEILDPRK